MIGPVIVNIIRLVFVVPMWLFPSGRIADILFGKEIPFDYVSVTS